MKVPSVSVVDRSANLPLDLQRFRLIKGRYPFADQFLADATRDLCAYCLTFAPDSPPWETSKGAMPWPDYPGWMDYFGQLTFQMQLWFYTAEGTGPPHLANLAVYSPPSALLLLALGHPYPQAIAPRQDGQAIFLGVNDLSFMSHRLPAALSNIFGRKVKNITPHLLFFTGSEGVTALMHPAISRQMEGFQDGQVDLSAIRAEPFLVRIRRKILKREITAWSDGSAPEMPKDLPQHLFEAVARGQLIIALLDRPRMDMQMLDSTFIRTWRELMVEPVIPYDREQRRQRFGKTYRELAQHVEKWERLRELGPAEIRRRFDRLTQFTERL